MTQPQALANKPTFDDAMAEAIELGKQRGRGKDTQVQFYRGLAEKAYHGVIDLSPDKHGSGCDDARKLTELYIKASGDNTVFDHRTDNVRKACSCARTPIKLGATTKWGNGQPLSLINDFFHQRTKLRAKPENVKKLDDPGNAFLKMARAQLKLNVAMTEKEMEQYQFKKIPPLMSNMDHVVAIRKMAHALVVGTASQKTVHDDSPEMKAIEQACTKRIKELLTGKAVTAPVTTAGTGTAPKPATTPAAVVKTA